MSAAVGRIAALNDQAKGILCMIAGVLVLTTQDAITKWLTAGYHAGEIMFYRGLFSFIPIAVLLWREGGAAGMRSRRPALNLVRALLALATSVLIVTAFAHMPLADVLAVVFASPLILTALSGPLLGEHVGWRRWSAVGVGFVGVLLLTRPGTGALDLAVLLPLGAAFFSALRDITTRRLGGHASPTTILLYTQAVATLAAAPSLAVNSGWPGLLDWLLFAAAGILVGLAHYLIIQAFLFAQAVAIAPFRYLALVWAMLIGFLVWGDVPDLWAIAGSSLIVGSGLYMLHRETRRRR